MSLQANIAEIFSSLQGEGPFAGVPFVFFRLGGCNLDCVYCDTRWAISPVSNCKIVYPDSNTLNIPNPVAGDRLVELLGPFHEEWLSFTGGEPMLQAAFISDHLPVFSRFRLLMETNGTLPEAVDEKLLSAIDVWSVDYKMPAVTGLDVRESNRAFLDKLLGGRKVVIKAVYSEETTGEELNDLFAVSKAFYEKHMDMELVIQPVWKDGAAFNGESYRAVYVRMVKAGFPVRYLPQLHKLMNIP